MINKKLLSQFRDIIRCEGFKFTSQRIAVMEEVIIGKVHRDCEQIYLSLQHKGKNVSRATVYRTMDILVKNGFARKMELGKGRALYESKLNSPHHDHLICTSCGHIIEFVDQTIEDLQNKIAKRYHFKLFKHIHQLFGICKKCHLDQ